MLLAGPTCRCALLGSQGKVVLDVRSNNQWKENAFVFSIPGACSASREHIPDMFRVAFGVRHRTGKCTVPPVSAQGKTYF